MMPGAQSEGRWSEEIASGGRMAIATTSWAAAILERAFGRVMPLKRKVQDATEDAIAWQLQVEEGGREGTKKPFIHVSRVQSKREPIGSRKGGEVCEKTNTRDITNERRL